MSMKKAKPTSTTSHPRISECENYSINHNIMKLKNPTSFSPFSAESLASLFSEKDQAGDLTFHTSDGDAVNAHSFIIAASMNPAWRDLIASHATVNLGDEGRVVIILPDVSTAELEAVLCFIYGMIDTYRSSTGQLWTKLLNTERVPHKLQIRKRSLSEEIHTPTSTFEAIKDDSDHYGDYHGDHAFDDDDAEKLSIPGSELGSEAEAKTLNNLNDIAIDDGVVLSTLPSHIVEKKVYDLRGVGSWWQCILTNCHYIAPDFPSLSDHLRSIHSAEKISLLRCEICSKLCKNKSSIVRHTFGEDCHRYCAEHKNRLMKFLHPFIHKIPLLKKSKVLAIVASYGQFFLGSLRRVLSTSVPNVQSPSTHSAILRVTSISTTWESKNPRFQSDGHYLLARYVLEYSASLRTTTGT